MTYWNARAARAALLGLPLVFVGCALLPVTAGVALPPPDRPDPGPGQRTVRGSDGEVRALEGYIVDAEGRVWRHGQDLSFWPDGSKRWEHEFDHDEPVGTWRSWWQNGSLRSEHTIDGDRATPMVYFHPNGQKASEGLAIRGRREGAWTYWFANGSVAERGGYLQGKRHGKWETYRGEGGLASSGPYELGAKVGEWVYR